MSIVAIFNVLMLLLFVAVIVSFLLIVLRGAPYIPSHKNQVKRAFTELYKIGAKDRLLDLGSGTGTVLSVAREYGATALGYELNPFLWLESSFWRRNDTSVDIRLQDYNLVERLPHDVTVVYAFTTSRSIDTIGKKLTQWSEHQDLVFISYGFTFTDRSPDKSVGPMNLYYFKKA